MGFVLPVVGCRFRAPGPLSTPTGTHSYLLIIRHSPYPHCSLVTLTNTGPHIGRVVVLRVNPNPETLQPKP